MTVLHWCLAGYLGLGALVALLAALSDEEARALTWASLFHLLVVLYITVAYPLLIAAALYKAFSSDALED